MSRLLAIDDVKLFYTCGDFGVGVKGFSLKCRYCGTYAQADENNRCKYCGGDAIGA